MEELKGLLEKISSKNPNAKKGIYLFCKKHPEVLDAVKRFINEKDTVSESDVLVFASDLVDY